MFDTDYRLASGIAIIRRRGRNPKAQCSGIQLNNWLRFVLINKYIDESFTGRPTFFYHQYFSSLTLLMFNSINFSLPPSPRLCPHFAPYIENPAIAHAIYIACLLL